jgi:YidC/Oxa1 family membrane protein insertase
MEKRLLLAVVLMTAAIMITNVLFPPPELPVEAASTAPVAPPAAPAGPAPTLVLPQAVPADAGDSVVVASEVYRYVFSTRGAALRGAYLNDYPSYSRPGEPVQLIPAEATDFFAHRLVVGADTLDLGSVIYQATLLPRGEVPGRRLRFDYEDQAGFGVTVTYTFQDDGYLLSADGEVRGLGNRSARLLTQLGPGLEVHEHPDHHSERELAVVTREGGSVDRLLFRRVQSPRAIDNPLTWAGIKDKYFLTAIIAGDSLPLAGAVVMPQPPGRRLIGADSVDIPRASLVTVLPVEPDGSFSFRAYFGPQDYETLAAVGHDLEEATPYGYRFLQPIIRPLAAAILWVLNTLHDTLGIAYGWVLVIFGVLMRIVLWPLNAKAMRAQMKNMGLQPILQEIREKYAHDREKQQEAMLAFYKEYRFNPLAGCLPLLVPMPVLITLFFVFQNTIAFRGADFLWLPDLSLHDPFYILPIILVVSMFGLQWVSVHLSGMEQNPQMKMMMYMMPVMMGIIFFMLPAGLNLYYAVTQVASLPQQVMIARERRRAQAELKLAGGPPKLGGPKASGKPRSTRSSSKR